MHLPRRTRLLSSATPLLTAGLALGAVVACAAGPVQEPELRLQAAVIDEFRAGETYTGSFADPTVMRVGDQYVSAGTTVANLNLPVMTSDDLERWTPRPALGNYRTYTDWRGYNDAMPIKAPWAATAHVRDRVPLMSQWAPSLAQVGDHYVAAYSAAVDLSPRKSCIGLATSDTPLGVYQAAGPDPVTCFDASPKGAIDPDIFVRPDNQRPFLLWKNEGIPQVQGPRLMTRRLTLNEGTAFGRRSKPFTLLANDQPWEAGVVENPSMISYGGRYYLFYSANYWRTADYAIGYAICETPRGPCRKPSSKPLLAKGGGIAGPGGADAVIDENGQLRLLYAAWEEGKVGPEGGNPRLLHVATVAADQNGRLRVTDRG